MKKSDIKRSKYLSIIIPVYNEEESIPHLHARIHTALARQEFTYEILYVDDGSTDNTYTQLKHVAQSDAHVRVLRFRRNFGQTAALAAGVEHSNGEILIFMDGDLQNDPQDIPRLLTKIEDGYDVVSGWRKNRQDAQWSRKFPSMIANKLISKLTGVRLHDYGCTLKAYRYEVFRHIRLYGEMHRFIPVYASLVGASITELEVMHHARQYGKSKYGLSRIIRVILDLTTIKFLSSCSTKPLYAFGIFGLFSLASGTVTGTYALGQSITQRKKETHRPSLVPISLLLTGFGILGIMIGLVAELLTRTYYESQHKPTYVLRDVFSTSATEILTDASSDKGADNTIPEHTDKLSHIHHQHDTTVA